ncbi:MAG: NRDE family protein [Thermodesulfobacteriota bacterium]|nr:NRDE family protein [Thermodesulfobacteriota bacterium]
MCLLFLAYKSHPLYPLVLAANRDEFYDRPSQAAEFWEDRTDVLAGRDLKGGGTWLGITKGGRIAAITNFRDLNALKVNAPSRGLLVGDYLLGNDDPGGYLRGLKDRAGAYSGFNIVVGNVNDLYYFSNMDGNILKIQEGPHGLSNHFLDTPWPKVGRGKELLGRVLSEHEDPSFEAMFDVLADRSRPDDSMLPDTGIGLEWERILSPIFVETEGYGTRSSTIILVNRDGEVTFIERVFDGDTGGFEEKRFDFEIRL